MDPVTLFAAGSALTGAVGSLFEGAATAEAAEYNAAVSRQNAAIIRDQGRVDAANKRRDNLRNLATIRASYGANGIAFEGSALDFFEDQATEMELDARLIEYGAEVRARGLEDQAELQDMEAGNAIVAGLLGAGASITRAGTSYYQIDYPRRA